MREGPLHREPGQPRKQQDEATLAPEPPDGEDPGRGRRATSGAGVHLLHLGWKGEEGPRRQAGGPSLLSRSGPGRDSGPVRESPPNLVAITRPRDLLPPEAASGGVLRPPIPDSGPVADLADRLRRIGLLPVWYPLTRLVRHDGSEALRKEVKAGTSYDLLVLTSRRVPGLLGALLGLDRLPSLCREVWCVGPGTATAARRVGMEVHRVAERHIAEGLLAELGSARDLEGIRILLPRSLQARPLLARELEAAGARVGEFHVYRSEADEAVATALVGDVLRRQVGCVTLTAASGADSLARALGASRGAAWPVDVPVVVIGPEAGEAARSRGIPVACVASPHNLDGIVAGIQDLGLGRGGGG
ncbi:MAG: uroporphyrinogen-III synthase [Gemmatimonadales bacterium]|nr:MAG: uroporphyrinogen-III synthase [Gemmatimonadales bacterium]